mmetsp:Transcript_40330/g.96769  ORF Transcript_40330/g.96769 Transcript_40330/m.96769 type:complete len:166 (+) Transcript_40330:17-514(+)
MEQDWHERLWSVASALRHGLAITSMARHAKEPEVQKHASAYDLDLVEEQSDPSWKVGGALVATYAGAFRLFGPLARVRNGPVVRQVAATIPALSLGYTVGVLHCRRMLGMVMFPPGDQPSRLGEQLKRMYQEKAPTDFDLLRVQYESKDDPAVGDAGQGGQEEVA